MLHLFLIIGWTQVSSKAGVMVESREVAGLRYLEYRASAHSPLPVERFDQYMYHGFTMVRDSRIERVVVESTPTRVVVRDRLKMPLGSDRHYTLAFVRVADPQTHVVDWRFAKTGPGTCGDCVEMPDIHGTWTFVPTDDGGTDVTYVVYSDPGGDFPKFMVSGKQADGCGDRLRLVLQDVR